MRDPCQIFNSEISAEEQIGRAMNKAILDTLKKRLEDTKGKWKEKLPRVLWFYRTTIQEPSKSTPFSLVYGTETVIPAEVVEKSVRTKGELKTLNDQMLIQKLEELEEKR